MKPRTVVLALAGVGLIAAGLWWKLRDPAPKNQPDPEPTRTKRAERGPNWFMPAGAPDRRIAGRVAIADASGTRPVKTQVTLSLADVEHERSPRGSWQVESDGDGIFDFGARPAAAYHVTASEPGYTPASVLVQLNDPDTQPDPESIELILTPCTYRAKGTISDVSGGVIAGARVRLGTLSRALGPPMAVSDDEGNYVFCFGESLRRQRNLAIEVTADGYGGVLAQVTPGDAIERDVAPHPRGDRHRARGRSRIPGNLRRWRGDADRRSPGHRSPSLERCRPDATRSGERRQR